jgi:hypothetical protein
MTHKFINLQDKKTSIFKPSSNILIVAAHFLECEVLYKELPNIFYQSSWKRLSADLELYKLKNVSDLDSLNFYLLLTGEGYTKASQQLWLSLFFIHSLSNDEGKAHHLNPSVPSHKSIDWIINLGVCGALRPDEPIGKTYLVEGTYLDSDFPYYPLYSHHSLLKSFDKTTVVTVNERLKKVSHAERGRLATRGWHVDREIAGLAQSFSSYQKLYPQCQMIALKVVSDVIPEDLNENSCQDILKHSYDWANLLWEGFQSLGNLEEERPFKQLDKKEIPKLFISPEILTPWQKSGMFYFTESQKRLWNSLIVQLNQPELFKTFQETLFIPIQKENFPTPKWRTLALINRFKAIFMPHQSLVQDHLNKKNHFLKTLSSNSYCQFLFDHSGEDQTLYFYGTLQPQSNNQWEIQIQNIFHIFSQLDNEYKKDSSILNDQSLHNYLNQHVDIGFIKTKKVKESHDL